MDEYTLYADEATEGDLIIWQNLGVSAMTRCFFIFINILVCIIFLIIATILIVLMRNLEVAAKNQKLKAGFSYDFQ